MSKEVKEWKPNPECDQCKQAVRIFDSHQRIAEHSNAMAIKQIRTIWDERVALEKALSARAASNKELIGALKQAIYAMELAQTDGMPANILILDAIRKGRVVLGGEHGGRHD